MNCGSMFVWIPRYAYKITSGCNTNVAGTIEIKFLEGITNKYGGEDGYARTTYPTVANNAMEDFILHPAFQDGTNNNFTNGEWDDEIPGFWIAKFTAGFQARSIDSLGNQINLDNVIRYSSLNYTSYTTNTYKTNALDQNLSSTGYLSEKISYPVFKPKTYVYNVISTGDSYSISREIAKASDYYGLSESDTDSHITKNSEWGAVAYLTHSSYGRNSIEPNINSFRVGGLASSKNINAVTGFVSEGKNTGEVTNLNSVYAYNTDIGGLGSSTGNIYGVYDLNGCIMERVAGYIVNPTALSSAYGSSYATTTTSTKYATAYPYNDLNDTATANWQYFNANYTRKRYGDSILEMSSSGSGATSWNSDYSMYPAASGPFLARGGVWLYGINAGVFAFNSTTGTADLYHGFRSVLISF